MVFLILLLTLIADSRPGRVVDISRWLSLPWQRQMTPPEWFFRSPAHPEGMIEFISKNA